MRFVADDGGSALNAKHTCTVESVFEIIKIYVQVIQKKVRQGELTHQKGSFYEKNRTELRLFHLLTFFSSLL